MLNVTARQELMRTIVETLGVVVEEARLDFGEDGLSVRVVDPSHAVSYTHLTLPTNREV